MEVVAAFNTAPLARLVDVKKVQYYLAILVARI